MRAFLSYHTEAKLVAAPVADLLGKLRCATFMAHEDIEVSQDENQQESGLCKNDAMI